jgi:membrane protease subunit HflK
MVSIFSSGPWGEDKTKQTVDKAEKAIKDVILDFKKESEKLKKGSNNNNNGDDFNFELKFNFMYILLGALGLWLASGFYKIEPGQEGVVTRFGAYIQTTQPGLNYHLPSPIEQVAKVNSEKENITEIGFRSVGDSAYRFRRSQGSDVRDIPSESLMLTGDQRIVDLDFTVLWKVGNARDFIYNLENPVKTIRAVAESSIREVIGQNKLDDALTDGKTRIQNDVKALMIKVLDSYKSGVEITGVQLQQTQPPAQVMAAFLDVKAALKDADRMRNEAQGYANDVLPKAKGKAEQMLQEAEGYKQEKIAVASGEADRFLQQQKAYTKARTITEKRLYIEAMEEVLRKSNKVIMSAETGGNVLPYLPLNKQMK